MSARRSAGVRIDRASARPTNWKLADHVGDGISATVASSQAPGSAADGGLRHQGGGLRRFGLSGGWCNQNRTLIRHAAASGAISAAPIGMHLPPAFARLVSATGLPLPAAPHLRGTLATAVHLAAVASATDNDLLSTTEAKK